MSLASRIADSWVCDKLELTARDSGVSPLSSRSQASGGQSKALANFALDETVFGSRP